MDNQGRQRRCFYSAPPAFLHVLPVVVLLLFLTTANVRAQQAGLMVVHGNGETTTRCVSLPEAEVTGLTLVLESGLELGTDITAMGASICRLDGEGCENDQPCFCACTGSPCVYWSYWRQEEGQWRYSMIGAASTTVGHGDVEAWVWAAGMVGREAEIEPPPVTFADLCSETVAHRAGQAGADADSTAGALPSYMGLWLVVGIPILLFVLGALWWLWRRPA